MPCIKVSGEIPLRVPIQSSSYQRFVAASKTARFPTAFTTVYRRDPEIEVDPIFPPVNLGPAVHEFSRRDKNVAMAMLAFCSFY